jgi:hypothetical protein
VRPDVAAVAPVALESDDRGRLRVGLDVAMFFKGGSPGATGFGGALQFGWQINRSYAVYYRPAVGAGVFVGVDAPVGDTLYFHAYAFNSIMIERTLDEWMQLGIGPSIDLGNGGPAGAWTYQPQIGADVRVAVVLGGGNPAKRRYAFSIVADFHPDIGFARDGVNAWVTSSIGIGGALF